MDIGPVSPGSLDFMVDFYFRQKWHDPRLTFDAADNVDYIVLSSERQSESIWLPDTFISTAKQLDSH
ncbi:hypothetical protein BLA29_015101, partial [Euroglyphus maynei]